MKTNKPFEIVEKEESGNFILDNGLLIPGGGNLQIVDTDIIAISENYISNIQVLEMNGTIYTYQIIVIGQAGVWQNAHLSFTDEIGDVYDISIHSPMVSNHTLNYNSSRPHIKKITLKW